MISTFRFLAASLVVVIGLSAVAHSEDVTTDIKPNPEVDKLAHEGYWLKDNESKFKPAMEMLGQPAPDLKLADWRGDAVTRDKQKGKIILIDFWATWCGPCIKQIPHANEMSKKYADKGVVVYGACCPEGSDTMAKVADEHKMEYPTGKLTEADAKSWKISFWPTYAVIDRDGKLRAIGLRPDYVEKVLDALLVEQPLLMGIGPVQEPARHPVVKQSTTVVYVCNSSASMSNKMATLKDELGKSVANLKSDQSFDIIFYHDTNVDRFKPGLVAGSTENLGQARAYLEDIKAKGVNNPVLGLTAALKLKPELVYFLSDGTDFRDPEALLAAIKKFNVGHHSKIQTILFVENKAEHEKNADAEELMRQIARDNGGQFRWVEMDNIP